MIENALPVYTSKLSLELSYHKSPSCKDVPSFLCVGSLLDIIYKSAKLLMSATFIPAFTILVILFATVATCVATGINL